MLPNKQTLLADIHALKLKGCSSAKQSEKFLLSRSATIQAYDCVEDLACDENMVEAGRRPLDHHFMGLRNIILTGLSKYDVWLGYEAMDRILFAALKNNQANIVSK